VKSKVPGEEEPLSLRLLGRPEVSIEGRPPLRFGTKKSLALLCHLAAEGGRHPRRELAELLWPMSDERHARTDLRSALAKLRKTLGEVCARDKEVASFFIIEGDLLGVESRGTELARKAQHVLLLWRNLDHLGRAYKALLELDEARRVHEEALELGGQAGPHYEAFSSSRLCAVAALSEEWEEAYAHAKRACEGRTSLDVREGIYLYHEVEALARGGDERSDREEVRRLAERVGVNERERIAYLRSLAVFSEFEGNTKRAIDHLHEAEALAEKIGLPKELWQIQSRIGDLHERRGEEGEAREAYSGAAQTLRMLAQKIGDEELREGFLSAPQVRSVLERS